MGHYDNCREGYCAACGAAPGNIKSGKCEFCTTKSWLSKSGDRTPATPKVPVKEERHPYAFGPGTPYAPDRPARPARPVLRQDKVLEVLRGEPGTKIARKGKRELHVHIFRDGAFTVQIGGREVAVGTGGRAVAELHAASILASAAGRNLDPTARFFTEG